MEAVIVAKDTVPHQYKILCYRSDLSVRSNHTCCTWFLMYIIFVSSAPTPLLQGWWLLQPWCSYFCLHHCQLAARGPLCRLCRLCHWAVFSNVLPRARTWKLLTLCDFLLLHLTKGIPCALSPFSLHQTFLTNLGLMDLQAIWVFPNLSGSLWDPKLNLFMVV